MRGQAACTAALAVVVLSGCGGGERQDSDEPAGAYPVEIVKATFPAKQRLAQRSQLQIAVRNSGERALPNVAVTVESGDVSGETTTANNAQAFAEVSEQPGLADPSRPVWVLDDGPRGGTTAYRNTWALGALRPGQVKTFVWKVTAVKSGVHAIKYKVAAGLDGKARAVLAGRDREPSGQFTIDISGKAADARVGARGQVITEPR